MAPAAPEPAGEMASLPEAWIAVLSEAVQALVSACNPSSIILFGSLARGQGTSARDIDLLVVIDDDAQWMVASRSALKAVARLDAEVDVVVTTAARLDASRDIPGTVIRPALREGKVVYQRAA